MDLSERQTAETIEEQTGVRLNIKAADGKCHVSGQVPEDKIADVRAAIVELGIRIDEPE